MLTKGEIQNIDFSGNSCTVRLPLFETVGSGDRAIATAYFAITPGVFNSYKIGDIVIVGFDRDMINKPYILGKLYTGLKEEQNIESGFRGAANCESLIVKDSVTLPESTKIAKNTAILDSTDDKNNITTIANLITTVKTNSDNVKSITDRLDAYQLSNNNLSGIAPLAGSGYLKRAEDGAWSLNGGSAASDYIVRTGDTMTGTLKLANIDNALELPNKSMIKTSIRDSLRTIWGFDNNADRMIMGSQYTTAWLRGKDPRPLYTSDGTNGEELALKSDIENYSTNEVAVGTWTDGKILYRKTIISTEAIIAGTETLIGSLSCSVDTITKIDKVIRNSSAPYWFADSYINNFYIKITTDGNIYVVSPVENWGSPKIIVTIEYTKAL